MEISLNTVSDHKLLRGLDELVAKSRQDEADLLGYLAEVDQRKLYLEQDYGAAHMARFGIQDHCPRGLLDVERQE